MLHYALRSVLAQTFQDFEVRIVGDGCNDDSEQVVAAFGDPRLHWENLPENTGNQALPNNRGIERAHGAWIAYLGHDDLWHPRHLERLIAATDDGEHDLYFTLAEILLPGGERRISGLLRDGAYGEEDFVPPSSLLHRRELLYEIGPWRDYRTTSLPPDFEWQQRARAAGKRFRAIEALTVFKLPSAVRKDSYLRREAHEQAEIWRRLSSEPDFAERELLEILRQGLDGSSLRLQSPITQTSAPPGFVVRQMRWMRGLEPGLQTMERLPAEVGAADLPIAVGTLPEQVPCSTSFEVAVEVSNRTEQTLQSAPPHPLHLSYRWFAADGTLLVEGGLRTLLHPPLGPGETRSIQLRVRAPQTAGPCRLRVALVQELVRWFDEPVPGMQRDFVVRVVPAAKT